MRARPALRVTSFLTQAVRTGGALLCLMYIAGVGAMAADRIAVSDLRCEYLVDPLGIRETEPRLSWVLESDARGQVQTAYRILVASTQERLAADEGDLWDSGRIESDRSVHVVYQGAPLESRMTCWWKVRVWDKEGEPSDWSDPAFWTMGLLDPGDWEAKWIGGAQEQIDEYLPPPDNVDHNGFHSEFAPTGDTEKWVIIDLGEAKRFDAVRLFPARPFGWVEDVPGFLFPMRFRIDLSDDPEFGSFETVVDKTQDDFPNPGAEPQTFRFEAREARYVRLLVSRLSDRGEGHFAFALAEMQVLLGEENLALNAAATASDSIEQNAWSITNLTDGVTESRRAEPGRPSPCSYMRTTARLDGPPLRAYAYVSALGAYELHINGHRVGDHVLAPEWTDYNSRVQYQTYDVTRLLREGENAVGAIVGDGWYAGRIGFFPGRRHYGDRPWLIVQIEVELADGSRRRIVTDTSWRVTLDGPIRSSDILDGEVYDARMETPGWDTSQFDSSAWHSVAVKDDVRPRLVSQPNEPIRITQELRPISLSEPSPGVYVFDLGQNIAGWCRIRLRGQAGPEVRVRHAEVLNADGTVYTANLRSAAQTDTYTLRGEGEEVFEPHFTYHGFRYVEVTGLPEKPDLDSLVGCAILSAPARAGTFECSHPMLNRLMSNIVWTQRDNMPGIPTDCPQRDERLGWMGDAQVFSQAAIFNMDMAAFFTKWIQDIRDAQRPDGRYTDFCPDISANQGNAPAWADAGVIVPWRLYQNYGDTRVLERHFESAKRYIDTILRANPDLIWRNARGADYGDWLNGDTLQIGGYPKSGGAIPIDVFATAYFAHSTELLSKMASVIGQDADAKEYGKLALDIKSAFNREFVKPDGEIDGDTQAGYALALDFDLLPEDMRPEALKHLLHGIEAYGGRLSTGFLGTRALMLSLAEMGQTDVAYRLLLSHQPPSWLYMIDHGATTIWERWDCYVEGRGQQDPGMNSYNHYAFGAVGEWMYRHIAGVNPDPESPGWKRFVIRPRPGGGITWVRASFDSIRGLIATNWSIEDGVFTLNVTIPANTMATVYVPTDNPGAVTESGKPGNQAKGVRFVRLEDACAVYEVGSGTYSFRVR
jgi:alpha-L-rhamnosidase